MIAVDEVTAEGLELRCDGCHICHRKALPCERRRLDRERLRRPGLLAGHVARGHLALLDVEDRLTVYPVEEKKQAGFGDDSNRRNDAPALFDIQ